jgi:hypothetical protein
MVGLFLMLLASGFLFALALAFRVVVDHLVVLLHHQLPSLIAFIFTCDAVTH